MSQRFKLEQSEAALISVIVPVYNVELYLPRCIDSLLCQTHRHLQIILINDGSTDKSGDICDMYANTDDRIIVIHQENKGLRAARNAGMDAAAGQWLGFVDSDDWIEPEMYEKMLSTAHNLNAKIIDCGVLVHELDGSNRYVGLSKDSGAILGGVALEQVVFDAGFVGLVWNKLFCAALITGADLRFNTTFKAGGDVLFVMQALIATSVGNVACIQDKFYHWCKREGSITTSEINFGRLDELDAYAHMVDLLETVSEELKCHMQSSLVTCATNLTRSAVLAGRKDLIPYIRKKARLHLCAYFRARHIGFRGKATAAAILFFPRLSIQTMQLLRSVFVR